MRTFLAVLVIAVSVWVLESARSGIQITQTILGGTPVTSYAAPDANGPAIVIAHGFAGSAQMMQGYALPLAAAGYRVYAFDFLGHGRHTVPMSGDVNAIEGTTRLLMAQTADVIGAINPQGETVGLLGHSMATDILVRVAAERKDIGPMVLLSAFSDEITADRPEDLLLLVGAWEPGLRGFAVSAAEEATGIDRQTIILPMIEHVSILQSRTGQAAARDWFNERFGHEGRAEILPMGPAIVALFAGLVVLFVDLARRLPRADLPALRLSRGRMALALIGPMVVAPPLAVLLNPGWMPVLVADYLALHLLIYGALQLGLLFAWRIPFGRFGWTGFLALIAACAVFAFVIDRYAANFWPTGDRFWIIGAMALGAVLFFVADARLSHRATKATRLLIHLAFLTSLVIAVMIDFAGLFFLLMIAPVVVLFYAVFGTMGHAVANRAGPLGAGLALGLMLAWALGVSFPLFQG